MGGAIREILDTVGDPGMAGVAVLLAVGLFCCFLGYRCFRFSAGVVGLVVGAELFGQLSLYQGWNALTTTILGLLGGAALATLFVMFAFLSIFGLGALLAATVVGVTARVAGSPLAPPALLLAGLLGGFVALLLSQFVVVVSTSLYGGVMAMAALFALGRGRSVAATLAIALSPGQGGHLVLYLLCLGVLVAGGIVVQFRYGKNPHVDS
jgi:hypothetical protein